MRSIPGTRPRASSGAGVVSRTALCAAMAALGVLTTAPGLAAQSDRPEVAALRFEGNQVVPDDSLRRAIVHEATRCRAFILTPLCWIGIEAVTNRYYFRARELDLDLLRLQVYYIERGYREVEVDTTLTRDEEEIAITFHIDEGRPVLVDSLEILLWEPIPDSSAWQGLPLRVGDPLSAIALDAARDSVAARLREEGHARADVLVNYFIPAEGYAARVTLDIDAGRRARFGAIEVTGNELLDDESVRRMLPFSERSRYRRSDVLEGQRNLYGLDIIQSAIVEEVRADAPSDSVIPVQVRVVEGDAHRVRTGIGWTTADCLTTEARWASRNFRGGARRLEVGARVSNLLARDVGSAACPQAGSGSFAQVNGRVGLELVQPWIFTPRNSLTAGAYVERQSLPGVFIRQALGLNVSLRRIIGRQANVTLSYEPQLTALEAAEVFFCQSFLACVPSDIRAFQSANWLAPIGLSVSRDERNSVLDPSQGWFGVLALEHAAGFTGSNFQFSRAVAEAAGYVPFGSNVGALRVRAGIVGRGSFEELGTDSQSDLVHPQKRFYAGGANSVRGFAENRLGPSVLTTNVAELLGVPEDSDSDEPACRPEQIRPFGCDPSRVPDDAFSPRAVGGTVVLESNLEIRFPIVSSVFQGVTFLDVGNVWLERGDVSLGDLEYTPGVGVRYFSPIGPIRVDVGYRFRGGQRLPVATSGVRPFDADIDDDDDRIEVRTASGDREPIPWVRTDDLTFLFRNAPFGEGRTFLSRLQLHFSIGQAF